MLYTTIKVLVSAVLIVAIAELGRRSALLGAALASLPTVTVLAMVWLYRDTGDTEQVARLSTDVFWLVLPSLILLLLLPVLLRKGVGFYAALGISCAATAAGYAAMIAMLRACGVEL